MVIITSYKRFENETDEELIYRICEDKDQVGSWQDVANIINELTGNDYGESTYRKKYQAFKKMLDANQSKFVDSDAQLKEIQLAQRELEKERKKIQSEKLEYSKWLRENARDELITEKICEAISTLPTMEKPNYIEPVHNNKSYLLALGDAHFGIEYEIKDLFGNVINAYSPDIFYRRMEDLLCQTLEVVKKENITELNVWELGDGIQGIIRLNSQLMKLRYGIIDSTVKYATYLSNWLSVLSNHVRVKFQIVEDSNHNQLRICDAPKNSFSDENMSKVMLSIIKERLKDNENFALVENPTGMNYSVLSTYQVLGYHGESKNYSNAVKDFSTALGTPLDYVIGAHIHHDKSEGNGISSAVLSIPSICGTDPYGMTLNKVSNAGATLFTFELGKGKVAENNFILN